MLARRLGGAPALRERNRALWTADDQYHWNGFLSVVISSCPSSVQRSATDSTINLIILLLISLIIRQLIIRSVILKCYSSEKLIALNTLHRLSPPGTHFTVESTEAMRIKCLAQ